MPKTLSRGNEISIFSYMLISWHRGIEGVDEHKLKLWIIALASHWLLICLKIMDCFRVALSHLALITIEVSDSPCQFSPIANFTLILPFRSVWVLSNDTLYWPPQCVGHSVCLFIWNGYVDFVIWDCFPLLSGIRRWSRGLCGENVASFDLCDSWEKGWTEFVIRLSSNPCTEFAFVYLISLHWIILYKYILCNKYQLSLQLPRGY